jgi:hypothetical protein
MNWIEITETEYMDVLAVLPPALKLGHGFLFDEPTIRKDGRPCYSPYLCIYGRYYAGSEPMTNAEFRALRIDELALPDINHREQIPNPGRLLPSGQSAHACGTERFTREAA